MVRAFTNPPKNKIHLKFPFWGGGVSGNQFPTFDAEFKFAKIQNSHVQVGDLFEISIFGGGGVSGNQFPTFDAEFKFAKIQNSHVQVGGGGSVETNFQISMLSSNLLRSKIPMFRWGPVSGNQFPTFDAEFKFAKIQNSHVQVGGSQWKPISNFWCWVQIAKIQNSYVQVGEGGQWKPISNFWCWVQIC